MTSFFAQRRWWLSILTEIFYMSLVVLISLIETIWKQNSKHKHDRNTKQVYHKIRQRRQDKNRQTHGCHRVSASRPEVRSKVYGYSTVTGLIITRIIKGHPIEHRMYCGSASKMSIKYKGWRKGVRKTWYFMRSQFTGIK